MATMKLGFSHRRDNILALTFFLRRGVPLPPIRTWACSFLSFSGFMLRLPCRASRAARSDEARKSCLMEKSPTRSLARAQSVSCARRPATKHVFLRRETRENGSCTLPRSTYYVRVDFRRRALPAARETPTTKAHKTHR